MTEVLFLFLVLAVVAGAWALWLVFGALSDLSDSLFWLGRRAGGRGRRGGK